MYTTPYTSHKLVTPAIRTWKSGDPAGAKQQLHTALAEFRQSGHKPAEAWTLLELARLSIVSNTSPNLSALGGWINQASQIYTDLGSEIGQAYALIMSGDLALMLGQASQALFLLHKAKDIFEDKQDKYGLASVLHELSRVASLTNDFVGAEQYLLEGLRISEELGDQLSMGRKLMSLGVLYLKSSGDLARAKVCYNKALIIFERTDAVFDADRVRHNLRSLQGLDRQR